MCAPQLQPGYLLLKGVLNCQSLCRVYRLQGAHTEDIIRQELVFVLELSLFASLMFAFRRQKTRQDTKDGGGEK